MKNHDRGHARFNVSDALDVPLRGFLLRLRHLAGDVSVKDIGAGARLRLTSPDGVERIVTVRHKSLTGGRNSQERLAKTGQIDVIIGSDEAYADDVPVGIGWTAEGPLRGEDGRVERGPVAPLPQTAGTRRRRVKDSTSGGWPFNPPGGY
jgi:hypothetical protein